MDTVNPLVLLGLLVLNAAISTWNAYACGRYWTESKIIGGWSRVMTWCGVVMAACGFTWVFLTIFAMVGVSTGHLSVEQADLMFKLGYLIIILPILGSGLAIWVDSVAQAVRERSFGSIARAGWNTYAQVHNTWQAASQAPGIFQEVMDAFFSNKGSRRSNDNKGAAGILVVLLVVVALSAGILTTVAIVRWADRRVALQVANA
jgi:hypothetical protein